MICQWIFQQEKGTWLGRHLVPTGSTPPKKSAPCSIESEVKASVVRSVFSLYCVWCCCFNVWKKTKQNKTKNKTKQNKTKQKTKQKKNWTLGRFTRALKTYLRDPDLWSGSIWSRVKLDTARTEQSCQIRINSPAYPCRGKVICWDPHWIRIPGPVWSGTKNIES